MQKLGRPRGSKNSKQRVWSYDKTGLQPYKRLFHANGYEKGKLDFDVFLVLVKQDCYYCGSPPRLINPYGSVYKENQNGKFSRLSYQRWQDSWVLYNGIDKKEPKEDYLDVDNLLPCCKTCNFLKQRLGHDLFLEHVRKIANRHPVSDSK